MNAKEARKIANKANADGWNYQVKETLRKIEQAASVGKTWIILDDPLIHLYDVDIRYIENLGYRVIPARTEWGKSENMRALLVYGRIEW
jgi:hypothetical protein